MKKLTLLLILIQMLSSCTLFMSKDELLTRKEWMLDHKNTFNIINNKHTTESHFYKKSDEALIFNFKPNGTVRITENKGTKFATTTWKWHGDDKIRIKYDNEAGEYIVAELSYKKLHLTKRYLTQSKSEYLYFKHKDCEDWSSDEVVDLMNEMDR